MTASLIISLAPDGEGLQAELPGPNGGRRVVPLVDSTAAETLRRILQAQGRSQTEIGLDGAPTQAQVRHWERHFIWTDPSCRFCIAEGRTQGKASFRTGGGHFAPVPAGDGSVTVRRLPAKGRAGREARREARGKVHLRRSLEDLEL